jgi:hypothetical protein
VIRAGPASGRASASAIRSRPPASSTVTATSAPPASTRARSIVSSLASSHRRSRALAMVTSIVTSPRKVGCAGSSSRVSA